MATATLTLSGIFQLTCSTAEQVQAYFTDDTVIFEFNPNTVGGIDDFKDNVSSGITTRGGTVTTSDVTYDDGTCQLTVNYVFDMDTDIMLMSMLGGTNVLVPMVEIQAEAEVELCTACQELTLQACQDTYTITAGLTADTDYVAAISWGTDREYVQDVTSDGVGDIVIETSELPEGFTTPEHSPAQLEIRNAAGEVQNITSGSQAFPCVNMNFIYRENVTPVVLTMFIMADAGDALTDDSGDEIEFD